MFIKIVFCLLFTNLIKCESDNMQNNNICEVCKCIYEENIVNIDCSNRNFKQSLDNWTTFSSNINVSKYNHFIISFKNNNLINLKSLPKIYNVTVEMSFANCSLSNINDGIFENIQNLTTLDLSSNKLEGSAVRRNIFKNFNTSVQNEPCQLEIINLGNNKIHSLQRKIFNDMPKLRVLYLNNNPIKVFDSATIIAISQLYKLEILDISYTDVSEIPDNLLRNLKNIKELYLTGNKLKTIPESLGILGNSLEVLIVNENQIVEISDNSFLGLWRIEVLQINGMSTLTSIKPNAFIQLKSLTKLHLCANPTLEYISHDAFDGLKINWRLKEVYLNDNNLKTLPKELFLWKSLNSINLDNNPWNCDCEMSRLLEFDLKEKIAKGSHPKCITPLEMSGTELLDLNLKYICPSNGNIHVESTSSYKSSNKNTKKNSILITFSVLAILLLVGIIVGVRISQWRENLRRVVTAPTPVRYTNIRSF